MLALTIINLLILIILLILNINFYLIYIFNIFLLLGLIINTYMKKVGLFLLFGFATFISSLYLNITDNNCFLLLVYYIIETILLILCFYHTFNLYNNKLNLTFKNIELPKDLNYVVAKYLSGPLKSINGNTLIQKLDNYFLIKVEDNQGNVEEVKLYFNEIQSIDIKIKPYYKSVKKYEHTDHEYFTSHFESNKGLKIVKSYEVKITTSKSELIFLCFNYPTILNNITNKNKTNQN